MIFICFVACIGIRMLLHVADGRLYRFIFPTKGPHLLNMDRRWSTAGDCRLLTRAQRPRGAVMDTDGVCSYQNDGVGGGGVSLGRRAA